MQIRKHIALGLCFLLISATSYAWEFFDWDSTYNSNSYSNNSYSNNSFSNDYNNYDTYTKLDLSYSNLYFTVDCKSSFVNDYSNKSIIAGWSSQGEFDKNMKTRVAPNINMSDYSGCRVDNNTTWSNYSSTNKTYEPQTFSNVATNNSGQYQSFNVTSNRGGWHVTENASNITYGTNNLPLSLSLTTMDVSGNTSRQNISNIQYKQAVDQSRYTDMLNLCQERTNSSNYHEYDTLSFRLSQQQEPPSNMVSSFNMEYVSPSGDVTNMSFSNIKWDMNTIVGFNADITSQNGDITKVEVNTIHADNGMPLGFGLEITQNNKTESYVCDTNGNIAENQTTVTDLISQKTGRDVNPLDLMGSSKIQLGDAKLAFLTETYDDNGLLSNSSKEPPQINYDITDKPTPENTLKTEIAQLEQTAPTTVKQEVHNTGIDFKNTNEQELSTLKDNITKAIENKLSEIKPEKQIQSELKSPTDNSKTLTLEPQLRRRQYSVNLELDDNKIVSNNTFKTEGGTIKNAEFSIQNNQVIAVKGTFIEDNPAQFKTSETNTSQLKDSLKSDTAATQNSKPPVQELTSPKATQDLQTIQKQQAEITASQPKEPGFISKAASFLVNAVKSGVRKIAQTLGITKDKSTKTTTATASKPQDTYKNKGLFDDDGNIAKLAMNIAGSVFDFPTNGILSGATNTQVDINTNVSKAANVNNNVNKTPDKTPGKTTVVKPDPNAGKLVTKPVKPVPTIIATPANNPLKNIANGKLVTTIAKQITTKLVTIITKPQDTKLVTTKAPKELQGNGVLRSEVKSPEKIEKPVIKASNKEVNGIKATRVRIGDANDKIAVIGRTMDDRVKRFADGIGAKTWDGFNKNLSKEQNLEDNKKWVIEILNNGYTIYDVGLDPNFTRQGDYSKGTYYEMETNLIFGDRR